VEYRNATAAVIGAGDYIGAATAKKFAAEGFTIYAGRRNGDKLAPLLADVGPHVLPIQPKPRTETVDPLHPHCRIFVRHLLFLANLGSTVAHAKRPASQGLRAKFNWLEVSPRQCVVYHILCLRRFSPPI
jgi:NAD(P)-dependent dehydrogenase (short-subunit alcohol dehydrogenase family)